jgi:hypothetical protein
VGEPKWCYSDWMPRRKCSGWLHNAAGAPRSGWLLGTARAGLAIGLLASLSLGCAGSAPTPAGSQSVNATGALVTAIAAGALWAVGGGCRLQGCPYGSYCNQKNGFCEVRKCSEGCPDDTICNEGLDRCQVAPPPNPPTDFLPEDNLLLRPLK